MPHSTAPAASATGTPAPIEGAGAPTRQERAVAPPQVGMAWAAVATNTKDPLANAKNFIAASSYIFDV